MIIDRVLIIIYNVFSYIIAYIKSNKSRSQLLYSLTQIISNASHVSVTEKQAKNP